MPSTADGHSEADEAEALAWLAEPKYDIVRSVARGDDILPWALVVRERATGRESTWVRGKAVTRKGFQCAIGLHAIMGGAKRAYRPPMHAGERDKICEDCAEDAIASMEF
jgi:hypothetical protein